MRKPRVSGSYPKAPCATLNLPQLQSTPNPQNPLHSPNPPGPLKPQTLSGESGFGDHEGCGSWGTIYHHYYYYYYYYTIIIIAIIIITTTTIITITTVSCSFGFQGLCLSLWRSSRVGKGPCPFRGAIRACLLEWFMSDVWFRI